jgi:hypothetical protein
MRIEVKAYDDAGNELTTALETEGVVINDLEAFNQYFQRLGPPSTEESASINAPLMPLEVAMLRTYLYYKLHAK